jgi:hypothetical protein
VRKGIGGIVVVLVVLLGVAGCGGGDDGPISKAEYDRQLELVCNKGLKEREELITGLTEEFEQKRVQKPTPQYASENILKLITIYRGTTEEIADIGLPEKDEQKVEKMIQEREEGTAKVEASPLGTRDAIFTIFKEANELAEELEAKSCAF